MHRVPEPQMSEPISLEGRRRWSIGLAAAPAAVILAVAVWLLRIVFAPEASLLNEFALVDHDESVNPLSASQLGAVRGLAAAGLAALGLLVAGVFGWRRRIGRRLAGPAADARAFAVWVLACFRRPSSAGLVALATALVVGVGLRLAQLSRPMRFDEADTYNYFASRSLFNLLTDYTAPNNHIFHTLLAHYSALLFGDSPEAIRLPAFAAGLLILPAAFVVGRLLFDEATGLLAAAGVAVAPALVGYAVNARGYSMVTLLFLLLFVPGAYLLSRRSLAAWAAFVAVTTIGFFTIPVMLYPVGVVSAWMLLSAGLERRRALLLELVGAGALTAVLVSTLYVPAALRSGWGSLLANRYVVSLSWEQFLAEAPELPLTLWGVWMVWIPEALCWIAVMAVAASQRRATARRLALAAVAAPILLMTLQRVVPYGRVFLFLVPAALVLAGAGVAAAIEMLGWGAERRLRFAAAAAAVVAVGVGWFVWRGPEADPRAADREYALTHRAAAHIAERFGPRQLVVAAVPFSDPIRYHLLRQGHSRLSVVLPQRIHRRPSAATAERLWLMRLASEKDVLGGDLSSLARVRWEDLPVADHFEPPRMELELGEFELLSAARLD